VSAKYIPDRVDVDGLHQAHHNLLAEHPELNKQMTSMYVAMSVLRELMGERWLETHIMYGAKKKNVLTLIEADPASETAGQLRLMDLAEMMYNLQPVPGFIIVARLGNQHQLDALFCQFAKMKLLANASRKKRL
jgi:hypothetical protein